MPEVDQNDIYMQIIATIAGIGTELILTKYYDFDRKLYYYKEDIKQNRSLEINLNNLIDNLCKSVLYLLGSKYSFENLKNWQIDI
ncbi:hypothetical protein [Brachyspira hampsonii]|nr:hypothetical protein [Brachyspira hampsonii]